MEDRLYKKKLEDFSKDIGEGLTEAGDYIPKSSDLMENALEARNLSEDALAHQVLKNTGVPIPGKGATKSQVENFLNDLAKERYPELKNSKIGLENLSDAYGTFDPKTGLIEVNKDLARTSPLKTTSTVLHELGHKYDNDILNYKGGGGLANKDFRLGKQAGTITKQTDPLAIYEAAAKTHHAQIPKLREGSYGFGALKSLLKNGTFRGLAPLAIGAGLATSGDVSASDFIPGLDQAENVGESPEDENIMLAEDKARKNYTEAKRKYLEGLRGK